MNFVNIRHAIMGGSFQHTARQSLFYSLAGNEYKDSNPQGNGAAILRSMKQSLREMRAVQTKKDTDDGVIASIQWA
jgi:hypothetical protein